MAIETVLSNPTLIQSKVSALLTQPLQQASTFLAAGPKIEDSSVPVRFPRIANGTNAGFVAEGDTIPDGDVAFDEIALMPSTLKSIKVWLPFTNELLRQSAVAGLDAVLKQRLITDVAYALDNALFTGTGTANTVKGIVNQTGVQASPLDVTEPNSLLDAIALTHAANVVPNRWFMNPTDYVALRKLKSTTKEYIFDDDSQGMHADTVYQLFGIPVTVTNALPVGKAILADMNYVQVVRDLDSSVYVSTDALAKQDSLAIRVVTRYDMGLLQPAAVVVLTKAP
ncbi:phage major capsid protein [Mycobacterium sp. SMC-21]|uniref:phage major capsid protein n=1 Tax=Mycobacterium sp. SMC-21 TaxID=3381632 RepID=UPI0038765F9D